MEKSSPKPEAKPQSVPGDWRWDWPVGPSGPGLGTESGLAGWDWLGLGTAVPVGWLGLGTESWLVGLDWGGLGTAVPSGI